MKETKEKENPNKNNIFDEIIFKLTFYIFSKILKMIKKTN
jgi:hypothetical protein